MAQISRPFQIALVAVVLLGGVALFAFKGGSSSQNSSTPAPAESSAPPPASKPSSSAAADQGPTAPGVAGLSRAVDKAHGAVKTSEQNAKALEQKSQEASSNSGSATHATGGTSAPSTTKTSTTTTTTTTTKSTSATSGSHPARRVSATAPKQRVVEAELRRGDVVLLLFWDRKGADDVSVHGVVQGLAGRRVAVHASNARQVADYGSVTRGVQIYGTPTVVVIGRSGKAKVVTGLTDAYGLRQAISEARKS